MEDRKKLDRDEDLSSRNGDRWLSQDATPFGQEDRSDASKPGETPADQKARQGGPDNPLTAVDQHYSENIDSRSQLTTDQPGISDKPAERNPKEED
jgi:hypothetical protein